MNRPASAELAAQRQALTTSIRGLEAPLERARAWMLFQAALTRSGLLLLEVALAVVALRWLWRSRRAPAKEPKG